MRTKRFLPFAVAALALGVAAPAMAIVRRHDRPASQITALGALSQFQAVGQLNMPGALCSGTLISNTWVLTAAHCVDGGMPASSFRIGGITYTAAESIIHPNWTGDLANGFDIALVRLTTTVTGITPAILNTSFAEVGKTATYVGFGNTGDGVTGFVNGTTGIKRAGRNVIDGLGSVFGGVSSSILLSDFDSPDGTKNAFAAIGSSATALDDEASIAPGDSGGGMFTEVSPGQWRLTGVHSFIGAFGAPNGDGVPNAQYGEYMGSTRVSDYTSWINGHVFASAPEPTSMALFGLGLGAVAVRLRRRRAH
ncbi:MAG: S1 family peptidase [Armatimonadota bacterium]